MYEHHGAYYLRWRRTTVQLGRIDLVTKAIGEKPAETYIGDINLYAVFDNEEIISNIEPDFLQITSDLGNRWETKNLALKPYACGTMAQPFIDCAIKLKGKIGNVENIDKVIASVGEGTVHRLWEPLEEKQNPSTPYGAKFSVPYCISIGLINGCAGLNEFTEKHLKLVDRPENLHARVRQLEARKLTSQSLVENLKFFVLPSYFPISALASHLN